MRKLSCPYIFTTPNSSHEFYFVTPPHALRSLCYKLCVGDYDYVLSTGIAGLRAISPNVASIAQAQRVPAMIRI